MIALLDSRDRYHGLARALEPIARAHAPVHAHALVVAEAVAIVGRANGGKAARAVYEALRDDGVIHYPTPADVEAAMDRVVRFDGKLSLADCLTRVFMEREHATRLLSFDRDFDGKPGIVRVADPADASA